MSYQGCGGSSSGYGAGSAGFAAQGYASQGGYGGGSYSSGGGASYSQQQSQSYSSHSSGGGGVSFSGNAQDVARVLPAALANAPGYGQYEVVQQLSPQSLQAIDAKLLQHENPACCKDLAPAQSPDSYKLNVDQNPIVIRKKAQDKLTYQQEVEVKYLKPPGGGRGGDIVIRQQLGKQVAPAPPLIVRQQPAQPQQPQCIVLREAPPQGPQALQGKEINLPAKCIPPPARKVIVERLAPQPCKPAKVYLERWLGFGCQTQRVVFQKAGNVCVIPDPKNVVIQWDAPDVDIKHQFRNLGVHPADPQQYVQQYGSQLASEAQINEVAQRFNIRFEGVQLASQSGPSQVVLEGDVDALSLINLEEHGLGHLRNATRGGGGGGASSYSAQGSSGGYSAQGAGQGYSYSSQGAAGHGGYSAQGGYSAGGASYQSGGYSSQGGSYGSQGSAYGDCSPAPQPGC